MSKVASLLGIKKSIQVKILHQKLFLVTVRVFNRDSEKIVLVSYTCLAISMQELSIKSGGGLNFGCGRNLGRVYGTN